MKTEKYYLTPESWDTSRHQHVFDTYAIINTIAGLDWYENLRDAIDDCEYLGMFEYQEEAERFNKKCDAERYNNI